MVIMRKNSFMIILIIVTFSLAKIHVKAGEILTDTYESKLPVAYIDTENGEEITSKTEHITAHMTIVGNEKYPGTLYDGTISIKGRGNSTWLLPKKPYKIKLDTSTDMFGFGKNKHWVLLANYYDDSLMRNTLAQQVAEIMGLESMQTEWIDVVLNGEYIGNYQFSEQIRVGENRIHIFDWEDEAENVAKAIYQREKANGFTKADRDALEERMQENLAWITDGTVTYGGKVYTVADYYILNQNYNGGYLIEFSQEYDEISKFRTADGVPAMINTPEFLNTNDLMFDYIKYYIQQFENATYSSDGYTEIQGKKIHYSQLADIDSMINYWLLNELMGNSDAFKKSCYAYKDVDGLLTFGPPWDFDWAEGAITVGSAYDRWEVNQITEVGNFMKHWLQDPYYLIKAQERYWEIRRELDVMTAEGGLLETYYDYLKEAGHANNTLWNLYWGFEKDYRALKQYLNNHLAWLDEQMESEDSFLESIESYQRSESMTLKILDVDGNEVTEDDSTDRARADAWVENAGDLQLRVLEPSGTVSGIGVYVNGKYINTYHMEDGSVCVSMAKQVFQGASGSKNVIAVNGYDTQGNVIERNFCTIRIEQSVGGSSADEPYFDPIPIPTKEPNNPPPTPSITPSQSAGQISSGSGTTSKVQSGKNVTGATVKSKKMKLKISKKRAKKKLLIQTNKRARIVVRVYRKKRVVRYVRKGDANQTGKWVLRIPKKWKNITKITVKVSRTGYISRTKILKWK